MPAAIAVPAIASVAGSAIGAIGANKAQKSAQKQADRNYLDTQRQIDANMRMQEAWRQQMQGDAGIQQLLAQALGPQVTTQDVNMTTTQSQDYGPQQATLDALMEKAKGGEAEANVLQAEQLAALNRNISSQQQQQQQNIRNIAATRGVDPRIASLGMDQGINNQRLNAQLGIAQQGLQNVRQARGDVNELLSRYQRSTNQQRGRTTTTGGADLGGYIGIQQLLRPSERPVVQRQAV